MIKKVYLFSCVQIMSPAVLQWHVCCLLKSEPQRVKVSTISGEAAWIGRVAWQRIVRKVSAHKRSVHLEKDLEYWFTVNVN